LREKKERGASRLTNKAIVIDRGKKGGKKGKGTGIVPLEIDEERKGDDVRYKIRAEKGKRGLFPG